MISFAQNDYRPHQTWLKDPPALLYSRAQRYRESWNTVSAKVVKTPIFQDFFWLKVRYLIYTSNVIEDSGLDESDTNVVLTALFKDYQEGKFDLQPPQGTQPFRETVQHGQAFYYLCVQNLQAPLTHELIIETHRILMTGMIRGKNHNVDTGRYRTTPVAVGYNMCPPAEGVRRLMDDLLASYHEETNDGQFDMYATSAALALDFVMIHPFEDGNGRMSRLLLNYCLLRAGCPFPCALGFGDHKHARQHYYQAIRYAVAHDEDCAFLSSVTLEACLCSWSELFAYLQRSLPDELGTITENKRLQKRIQRLQRKTGDPSGGPTISINIVANPAAPLMVVSQEGEKKAS